jgi:membrane fusion protein (multidrug efflux system)
MGEYFLFVAKDTVYERPGADTATKKSTDTVETPKLRAFQKKVLLGQTIGPNVVVKSGINVGDQIIVDGVQAIHEGSPISTGPARQQANRDSTGQGSVAGDSTVGHRRDSTKHK